MTVAWEAQSLNYSFERFNQWESQNIALAAVAQCASLANSLAINGTVPNIELITSIEPLLVFDSSSINDIYPRITDLGFGLRIIQKTFSNRQDQEDPNVVRHTLGLLSLRNKLIANQQMQTRIREGLQEIAEISELNDIKEHKSEMSYLQQDRLFEHLAALYQDTISKLPYRIKIHGKRENLENERVANRIRALLLGGIRSAVLWYQLGGRRWRLVFYRKRVHETAGNIRRKLLTAV